MFSEDAAASLATESKGQLVRLRLHWSAADALVIVSSDATVNTLLAPYHGYYKDLIEFTVKASGTFQIVLLPHYKAPTYIAAAQALLSGVDGLPSMEDKDPVVVLQSVQDPLRIPIGGMHTLLGRIELHIHAERRQQPSA